MPSKTLLLHRRPVAVLLCLLAFIGCQKPQQPRTPVARIDNLTLTLEEIESRFDSSRGISQAQVHEYIQRWLTNELLYQEASRRGLDRTEDLEARLTDIRRQLAINALLEQEVYSLKSSLDPDDSVAAYFAQHKDDFLLSQDVVLISFVLFDERDAANTFRAQLLRGTSWNAAKYALMSDPLQSSHVITFTDSAYHTERSLLPAELWRVVAATPRREPSFPVRTAEGHYVLISWKLMRRGEVSDLDYVGGEIRSRIAISERQEAMDRLLENLRSRHVVQVLVSSVVQDSVSLRSQE